MGLSRFFRGFSGWVFVIDLFTGVKGITKDSGGTSIHYIVRQLSEKLDKRVQKTFLKPPPKNPKLQINQSAQALANTAWSFAIVNLSNEKLFTVLARDTELRVSEFNAQGLVNIAWAFAKAGQLDVSLLGKLARATERCVG